MNMVNKNKSADKLQKIKQCSLSLFSIDDYPESDWSSTPNVSNTNNAYNLQFHSSNHNVNNNNRNNGCSVRPITELTEESLDKEVRRFSISEEQSQLN